MSESNQLLGFIIASKSREKILQSLTNAKTPNEISQLTKIRLEYVSKILSQLVEKNLIKCLTPNLRKGKLYELTDLGNTILKRIKERNETHL